MGFTADGQGFEPWDELPRQLISNQSRSTTPAPLHLHPLVYRRRIDGTTLVCRQLTAATAFYSACYNNNQDITASQ